MYKWKAGYWKPIQTGIETDAGDTATIFNEGVDKCWKPNIYPPRYQLLKPLSPYEAMDYESEINVQLDDFSIPQESNKHPLVVEGAGGIAVPVTKKMETMADLIKQLISNSNRPFYIIVVARSGLGTLNHTFLTLDYLRNVGLSDKVLGVVVNGKRNEANVRIINQFDVKILATVGHYTSTLDALSDIPTLTLLDLAASSSCSV